MDRSLARNSDNPYDNSRTVLVVDDYEHPALNWGKLIFLIFLTYGLIVSMWFIWYSYSNLVWLSTICMEPFFTHGLMPED